ncbi:MAG: hypothetical protein ACOYL6_15820 [Bacteriovoracaceae bacterium]
MRKKLFINPAFQSRFVFFMLIVSIISMVMTYFMFNTCFKEFYAMADSSGLASNHPFRDLIRYQQGRFEFFFVIFGLVNIVVISILGLWMGHKIAGPIYRIVEALKNPNHQGSISTRKGDYFKELPEAINQHLS